MILVDSNIIIDALAGKVPAMAKVLLENDMAICGAVRSEVLAGSNSEKDLQELRTALKSFANIPMTETDWDLLGTMICNLRKSGLKVPFPDVIISCLALKTNSEIWTNDKHFKLIQTVFPKLKLFTVTD